MNKITSAMAIAIFFAACSGSKTQTADEQISTDTSAASVVATAEVDSVNAPVIKYETLSHNFGQITDGEKVSYEFKFINSGKSPLIISNAIASCGCTVPDYPRTPVIPGGTGVISVVFDSAGKTGMQDKVITVTANTVPQISQLHLTGEVKAKTK